jgi:hypothetical protein
MPGILSQNDWDLLLDKVEKGRCTRLLGADVGFGVPPFGCDVAKNGGLPDIVPST